VSAPSKIYIPVGPGSGVTAVEHVYAAQEALVTACLLMLLALDVGDAETRQQTQESRR
jgi:hypothetical protein